MKLKRFEHFLNEATLKNLNDSLVRKYCRNSFDEYSRIFKSKYSDTIDIVNKLFKNEEDNILYKEAVLEFIKSIFYFSYTFDNDRSNKSLDLYLWFNSNNAYTIEDNDSLSTKIEISKDYNCSTIFNVLNNSMLIEDIKKIFNIEISNELCGVNNISGEEFFNLQYEDITDIINKLDKHAYIQFEINIKQIRNQIEHTDKLSNTKSTFKYITIPSINIDDTTEEDVYNIIPWLKDCNFINADIRIIDNKLYWNNGTWLSGTWQDGVWYDGTWQDGTWENGIWYDGRFIDGEWYGGEWHDGEFSGIWHDGIFRDGTFEKGEWYDGLFEQGTFNNSTWHYGRFEGGYLKDSLWKDGIFYTGGVRNITWLNGLWLSGRWITGVWYDGVKLNNTGGTIEHQTWHEGISINDPTDIDEFHNALEEKNIKINDKLLKDIECKYKMKKNI